MTDFPKNPNPNTPRNVAEMATLDQTIPLDRLTLIGVRVTPQGNRALVRLADGAIETVGPGDTAQDVTIVAVAETSLQIVDRRGAARTLTMPG